MAIFSRGFGENWLLLGTKWLLSNAMVLLLCVDKAIIYHRSLYLLLKTRDPKHPSHWYPVGNGMSSKTHIAKNLHLLESRRRPYGGERDLWNSSVSARHETKQKYRPRTQFGNPGLVQRNRSLESCYKVTQVIRIYVWWRYFQLTQRRWTPWTKTYHLFLFSCTKKLLAWGFQRKVMLWIYLK